MDGFPVTYSQDVLWHGARYICQFCRAPLSLDSRGLPILDHPELGRVIVCYPCAEDLGDGDSARLADVG